MAATSTLWAFIGLESATIAAGEMKEPEKNERKSTIYGLLIAAVIYLAISIASMGAMSNEELANSAAPLTDILTNALGSGLGRILTISVVICILRNYYRMAINQQQGFLMQQELMEYSLNFWVK